MSIFKKIFLLSIVILTLSLLFWGVYNLSFKKPTAVTEKPAPVPETTEPIPTPSPLEGAKIKAISDEAVISPIYLPEEKAIKYYSRTGETYKVDEDGLNKSTISNQKISGLNDVLWSPDRTKVISKFVLPDGSVQFYYYNYATRTGVPIKKNTDEISWQSNGNKIFYKYYDLATKKRSLNISDPDGKNWTKLADIDYRDISIVQIPASGMVSFWNKPDAYTETIFESIPALGGERKAIFQGKFGADYLWSKDGTLVLVSSTDTRAGSKMQLAVMNYNGGEYRNLDAPTFVSKCAWARDGKTIYYSLPGNIPPSAILPNEYNEGKFQTTDTFWKINITDGKKTRIVEAADIKGSYDATDLFLNDDESILFFTNKTDRKIYRIAL